MVCKSWRSMCLEIYKEINWEWNYLLETNSHALSMYVKLNNLDRILISKITNKNCLNIIASIFIGKISMVGLYTYNDRNIIFRQFCETNNVSKPNIVKELCCSILTLTHHSAIKNIDIHIFLCLKFKSYEMAKYLIIYGGYDFSRVCYLIKYYGEHIDLLIEYFQFLIDNSAINIPYYYKCIHELPDYEHKKKLLEILSKYMKSDMVDIINKS
jgi:hypothetical protein